MKCGNTKHIHILVETTIKPMKKTIINSICCIFAALLILASITACDSSTEAPSDGWPSFDMPEALQGTWYVHPEDEGKYAEGAPGGTVTITENDIISHVEGYGDISMKDWYIPTLVNQSPYLRYEFTEEIGEYSYSLATVQMNIESNPPFTYYQKTTYEVFPNNPDLMICTTLNYNDEYGWTDNNPVIRLVREGTTPPVIY